MGTIKAEELLKQWKLQQLTLERGMGNTLQHLIMLHQKAEEAEHNDIRLTNTLTVINDALTAIQADVEALKVQTGLLPRRQRGRPRKQNRSGQAD